MHAIEWAYLQGFCVQCFSSSGVICLLDVLHIGIPSAAPFVLSIFIAQGMLYCMLLEHLVLVSIFCAAVSG